MTERFQPGGVTHALVSGLLELALAAALLAGSLAVSESSQGAAASLSVASLLWAVLAVVSLAAAWLRARVLAHAKAAVDSLPADQRREEQ